MFRPDLGPTQSPIQGASVALISEIKRPWREADHSSQSSAEIKNAWSYTSTPLYVFMILCLIKQIASSWRDSTDSIGSFLL
jgi:hypothetical protein